MEFYQGNRTSTVYRTQTSADWAENGKDFTQFSLFKRSKGPFMGDLFVDTNCSFATFWFTLCWACFSLLFLFSPATVETAGDSLVAKCGNCPMALWVPYVTSVYWQKAIRAGHLRQLLRPLDRKECARAMLVYCWYIPGTSYYTTLFSCSTRRT